MTSLEGKDIVQTQGLSRDFQRRSSAGFHVACLIGDIVIIAIFDREFSQLGWTSGSWFTVYRILSRIAGPGELFCSDFRACARSPRWATRCSFGFVKSAAAAMQQLDHRSASELSP